MMPARGVGRPRAIVASAARMQSAQNRRRLGSLQSLRIAPRTAARYESALRRFFEHLNLEGEAVGRTPAANDLQAARYIEHLWEQGDGKSWATDLLSALVWTSPNLKRQLLTSWGLIRAWGIHELPTRAPPLPRASFFALAQALTNAGHQDVGLGVVLAGHCLLRTGELLNLAWKDVELDGSLLRGALNLGITKSGARRGIAESVSVTQPWLIAMLFTYRQHHNKQPGDRFISLSSSAFPKTFADAIRGLGWQDWGFMPYSLRRGGATELWRSTGQLSQVTVRGRWSHPQTARIYVNDGLATLAQMHLADAAALQQTWQAAARKVLQIYRLPSSPISLC
jgi:integrase